MIRLDYFSASNKLALALATSAESSEFDEAVSGGLDLYESLRESQNEWAALSCGQRRGLQFLYEELQEKIRTAQAELAQKEE